MSSAHPIPAHRLRSGTLLRYAIVGAFLSAAGLSYVCLKHQLHVAGQRKKVLEVEMRDLAQRGRVLDAQIAELTSRTALQGRLKDGFIRMVEIPAAAVVHVRLLPEGSATGLASAGDAATRGLRPVAHESRAGGPRSARQ